MKDQKMIDRKAKRLNLNRRYLGPLNPREEKLHAGFKDLSLKEYCNMQKKHLKAYLKGDEYFNYKGRWYKVDFKIGVDNV